jgi:dephospho-CoA kinase
MISLVQLLKEIQDKPKAIFLAGPAGSGKSYMNKLLIPKDFQTINSDDTYEELLKASGIGLKQKDFTPDQLSQAAKLQAQARKDTQARLEKSIEDRNNIVIDGTGAASNPVLKKKQQLEELGYECLMLMIYVSPLVSLERNKNRDRSLMPSIILRTWRDVNKNVEIYQEAFKDKFILIDNNLEDARKEFNSNLLQPYLEDATAKGKPKTPEEQAKSDQQFQELISDIENMVGDLPKFDTIDTAKSKIKSFI